MFLLHIGSYRKSSFEPKRDYRHSYSILSEIDKNNAFSWVSSNTKLRLLDGNPEKPYGKLTYKYSVEEKYEIAK